MGKPLAVYVAREDRRAFRAAVGRPSASGHVESWRVRLVPKDGESIECRVHVCAVPHPGGAGHGDSGVAHVLYWVITPELCGSADDLV